MARDRYAYSVGATHAKPAYQRAITLALVAASVLLLVLARSAHPTLLQARQHLLDLLAPVMRVVNEPISATRAIARDTRSVLDTAHENRRLRAENEVLRHWQSVARALKTENDALRALQDYHPVEEASFVTARVIGQSPGAFGQTVTLNRGRADGVATLQPVVDAHGLVGRSMEVGKHATRVMLLSDAASRVPVITGTTRQKALIAGAGKSLLRLSFLQKDATLKLGEPVVTTQDGNLIPGGILVGHVVKRDANGYLVKPPRPLAQAEYMRVMLMRAPAPDTH